MALMASKAMMILSTGRSLRISVHKNAFTLIEVTLVSVIVLILITLSMPLFRRTYEDLKITSCTKDISQIIHFSRQRAIFERRNYRVVIDSDNNSYQILVQDEESDKFIPLADRWGRVYNVPKDIEILSLIHI